MKMKFASAAEMREKIPIGAKFRAYRSDLTIWSYEMGRFVSVEDVEPRRAMLEGSGDTVFVFNHRSSKYGRRLPIDYFVQYYEAEYSEAMSDAAAWERRVKSVIKKLDASGLWTGKKEKFEQLLQVGYDRRKALHDRYWIDFRDEHRLTSAAVIDKKEGAVEAYNAAFREHFKEFMNDIPFVFYTGETGLLNLDTFFIYEQSEAKMKSMYFGKWLNREYKEEIADAMANKRRITKWARTSYDVSFEYDPERNMAWYSEEYKDCGNGHYYIAIDTNTALFVEDD